MNIGKSINVACASNDVMKYELATAMGVSVQTVSYWVSGKATPSLVKVGSMAKFFDMSVSEFIKNGEGK